jgi:uncharacterized protein HemX
MPIVWTTQAPWPHGTALLWAAVVSLLLLCAGYAGWLHGTDQAIAAAETRAQQAAQAHDRALLAERQRRADAQDLAVTAVRRAAAAQRQLRAARAELRDLRNAITPLDADSGQASGCPNNTDEGPAS